MKRVKVQRGYLSRMPAKRAKYYDQSFADVINPPRTALIQKYGKKRDLQNLLQLITSLKSLDKYEPSLAEKWKAKWKNLETGNRSKIPGEKYVSASTEVNADEAKDGNESDYSEYHNPMLTDGRSNDRDRNKRLMLSSGEKDRKLIDDGDDEYDDPSEGYYDPPGSSDEDVQKSLPPSERQAEKIAEARKKRITTERNLEAMEPERKEQEQRDLNDKLSGNDIVKQAFLNIGLGTEADYSQVPVLDLHTIEKLVNENPILMGQLEEVLKDIKFYERMYNSGLKYNLPVSMSIGERELPDRMQKLKELQKALQRQFHVLQEQRKADVAQNLTSTLQGAVTTSINVGPMQARMLTAPISAHMPSLSAPIVPSLPTS